MFSAHPALRSATAAVMTSILCCGATLPQKTFSLTHATASLLLLYPAVPPSACENSAAGFDPNISREPGNTRGEARIPCVTVSASAPPDPSRDVPDEVVRDTGRVISCIHADARSWSCKNYESLLRADLLAIGKNGEKIERARERVLAILDEPNDCAAWFQQKDINAATTFRSLNFIIDAKGASLISALKGDGPEVIVKHPYVARVIQEGGSYQTITLNLNGAFFQSSAAAMETPIGGGPPRLLRPQDLGVGPYRGGTLAAQVATLLHELGHLEGLLPIDGGDVQGRSKQNTQEMLRYCRAAVEGSAKRTTLEASR